MTYSSSSPTGIETNSTLSALTFLVADPKLRRLVAYRDQIATDRSAQQIANMWDKYGNKGRTLREAISEAFSVEPVTKEFFETYRTVSSKTPKTRSPGSRSDEEEQKHLFTQTLFNRLMFVYFLSRKGWLKFDGDTDYLNALWTRPQFPSPAPRQFLHSTGSGPLFFSKA